MLSAVLVGWGPVVAGGPFRANFDDGNVEAWSNGGNAAVTLTAVPRDDERPGLGTCLSVAGKGVWISAETTLPEPITVAGPIYVTADIKSLGPCGQVSLLVGSNGEFLYYRIGPMTYDAKDAWVRAIWKTDGYFCDYIDGKVVFDKDAVIDGLKFAQRVGGGYDQGPDGPAHHELRVDNVQVHTGADAQRIAEECEQRASQRPYDGPQTFVLGEDEELTVWHAPSMAKVFRDQEPPIREGAEIRVALARNEAESFQIVLRSERPRDRLWLRLPELASADGKSTIGPLAWYWHPVHYVPVTTRASIPVGQWWPEPLSWDQNVSLEPGRTQSLWVTLDMPARTPPGEYHGEIELLEEDDLLLRVPVSVTVWNVTLPRRPTFRTNQQLWARGEHRKQMAELLARCRQYDAHSLGQLGRDFLTALMNKGQNALKLSLPAGHHGFAKRKPPRIRTGKDENGEPVWAEVFTAEFEKAFEEQLAKRTAWYRERGWMKYAFVYLWDEPWADPEVYKMITWYGQLVKRLEPDLKTLVAAAYDPKLDGIVDIFLSYSSPDVVTAARQKGIEFWWWGNAAFQVTLCGVDQRMRFGFESFQKGYTGSYCWGLGLWQQSNNKRRKREPYDPWTQPQRNNKSCTVFYPGGVWQSKSPRVVPSLSLELTRDGIEDYDYVTMLQAEAARLKDKESERARHLNSLVERCRAFYAEPSLIRTDFGAVDALTDLRAEIAQALAR